MTRPTALRRTANIATALIAAAASAACSSHAGSSASRTPTGGSVTTTSPRTLATELGCAQPPTATPTSGGVTLYRCEGAPNDLLTFDTQAITGFASSGGVRSAAPKVAVLAFFDSAGAQQVYETNYSGLAYFPTTTSSPSDQQADNLIGMQASVAGTGWMEWGNDPAIAASAINAGGTQLAEPK